MRALLLVTLAMPALASPRLSWFQADGPGAFRVVGHRMQGLVGSQGWRTDSGQVMRLVGARKTPGELVAGPKGVARFTAIGTRKRSHSISQQVLFRDVYAGIDLRYHFRNGSLEFDFELRPGASPRPIRFASSQAIEVSAEGDLLLAGGARQHRPVAWTEDAEHRTTAVAASYVRCAADYCLALGSYDHRRRLVIDPSITFGTYWGGPFEDVLLQSTVDNQGNLILLTWARLEGKTAIPSPITDPEMFGVTAAKFAPDGTVLYVTVLPVLRSGININRSFRITADAVGNLYALVPSPNETVSPRFIPSSTLLAQGPYILYKLNSQGDALIASCYWPELPVTLAADETGNVYVPSGGRVPFAPTPGAFRTTVESGAIPIRIVKLSATLTRVLAVTYIENPFDGVSRMTFDAQGNLIVAGSALRSGGRAPGAWQDTNASEEAQLSEDDGETFRPHYLRTPEGDPVIAVSPDENTPGRLWGHDSKSILYRSDDFGETWAPVAPLPPNVANRVVEIRTFRGHPNVLRLNANGYYLSQDLGITWTFFPVSARDIWLIPGSESVIGYSGGTTPFVSNDGGRTVEFVSITATSRIGNMQQHSHSRFLLNVDSGPLSWTLGQQVPDGVKARILSPFLQPAAFDPFDNAAGFFLQTELGLWPGVANLYEISGSQVRINPLPQTTNPPFLLAADPFKPGVLFAGTEYDLLASPDRGRTWVRKTARLPSSSSRRLFFDARQDGRLMVYVGAGRDVYFTRFSADLSTRLGSTFFGANGDESVSGLAVTPEGNVVLAGSSASTDWQERVSGMDAPQGHLAGFVAIFSPDGTKLHSMRLIGGSGAVWSVDTFCDRDGNIVIAGISEPQGLPVSANALAPVLSGGTRAAFLSVFDSSLNPLLTTGFPGDASNNIYVAGVASSGRVWIAGDTEASGLPTPGSTISAEPAGRRDLYIGVIDWK